MNSQEAINALFEGKCVRHHTWEDGCYIFMPLGGVPTYSDGRSVKTAAEKLFQINEWEICKERYQWLCYDSLKEEFFFSDPDSLILFDEKDNIHVIKKDFLSNSVITFQKCED